MARGWPWRGNEYDLLPAEVDQGSLLRPATQEDVDRLLRRGVTEWGEVYWPDDFVLTSELEVVRQQVLKRRRRRWVSGKEVVPLRRTLRQIAELPPVKGFRQATFVEKPIKLCTIPWCEERARSRGWCSRHYQHWYWNGYPATLVIRRRHR